MPIYDINSRKKRKKIGSNYENYPTNSANPCYLRQKGQLYRAIYPSI